MTAAGHDNDEAASGVNGREHRAEVVLTIALAALLLTAPWLLWLGGVRASAERENRPLDDFPEFDAGSLFDTAYYGDVEAALQDRLPGRQESATAINEALLAMTGWSPIEGAFVGTSGNWFLAEDFLNPCEPFRTPDVMASLDRWADSGEVYLAVAPDKSAVFADEFSWRARLANNCQVALEAEFTAAADGNAALIDLWTPLRAQSTNDPVLGPLYFATDSHWTHRGAEQFVIALLDRVRPGIYEPDTTVIGGDFPRVGDITRRLGFERTEVFPALVSRRPGVTTTVAVTPGENPAGVRQFRSMTDGTSPLISGRTLIIIDSMGNYAVDMLAPYFEEVTFVYWIDATPTMIEDVARGTDRIVFEVVQRDLVVRSENAILVPEFDAVLTRALQEND